MVALAEKDARIVAVSAAMSIGTGLTEFAGRFPDRFFDVGIAEEHALTMAAGMAAVHTLHEQGNTESVAQLHAMPLERRCRCLQAMVHMDGADLPRVLS